MEPWNQVRKQNLVAPRFHGTVEYMEPQFVNLMVSNNASQSVLTSALLNHRTT